MTLSASTRYVLYQPVVLTDTFSVPFDIFSNSDLRVVVDGVDTTAFSVAATYADGRSTNAAVVLTTAVVDVDVEIYGLRQPRRESNYLPSSPDLAKNLQIDMDALTASVQEARRDTDAAVADASLAAAAVSNVSESAAAAAASATEAAASAALAVDAQENLFNNYAGAWVQSVAYYRGEWVQYGGSSYVCILDHYSDLAMSQPGAGADWADYWVVMAARGSPGAGTGDVLAANAGSEYVPVAGAFRNNISAMVRAISKRTGINLATEASAIDSSIYNIGTGNTNLPSGAGDGDSLVSSKIDSANFNYLLLGDARAWLGRRVSNVLTWTELATRAYAEGLVGSVLHARDQKPSGTDGGTATAGAYAQRTLNVLATNAIAGASLAGNRITLPAGTYHVRASVPGVECGAHKAKLVNVTAGADLIVGQAARSLTGSTMGTIAEVAGIITLAVTSQIELQHRVTATRSAIGLGQACGFGDVEVYSEMFITKIS